MPNFFSSIVNVCLYSASPIETDRVIAHIKAFVIPPMFEVLEAASLWMLIDACIMGFGQGFSFVRGNKFWISKTQAESISGMFENMIKVCVTLCFFSVQDIQGCGKQFLLKQHFHIFSCFICIRKTIRSIKNSIVLDSIDHYLKI